MPTIHEWIFDEIQDNIAGYTKDEARYWVENDAICSVGSVAGMIYHSDTVKFFDEFENDILELANLCGFDPKIHEHGMLGYKNLMAWFAFEVLKNDVFEDRIDDFEFAEEEST